MKTFAEIEELALALPERQRADLAVKLLRSLPPAYDFDGDEEIAEALRRSADLDADRRLQFHLRNLIGA